jgi:chromosome condensin MukBEF ATPase and DNA-binding subunit MukB
MADELELDLNEDNQEEIISRKDSRIKSLSDKVKTTSEERDALAKEKEELRSKAEAAQKDADFFKGFNTLSSKYQGATEYQEKIREKVMSGYDLEDATISILAKEGKYTPPAPTMERESAAGGSAVTNMKGGDDKTPDKMSQAERLAALKEMESKGELDLSKL